MKDKKIWAADITKYLQKNPVATLEDAVAQIEMIVGWVQDDAGAKPRADA